MSISPRLALKLQHALGEEAAEDLVTWMRDIEDRGGELRADIAELRHEMQVGFARLDTRIEKSTADLMKWSFVFWVGAVLAIAVLAKVLE